MDLIQSFTFPQIINFLKDNEISSDSYISLSVMQVQMILIIKYMLKSKAKTADNVLKNARRLGESKYVNGLI